MSDLDLKKALSTAMSRSTYERRERCLACLQSYPYGTHSRQNGMLIAELLGTEDGPHRPDLWTEPAGPPA